MPYMTLGLCRSIIFSSKGQKVQKNQAEMKKNHSPLEILEREIDFFPVTFCQLSVAFFTSWEPYKMSYITFGLCRSLVFSSTGQKVQKNQA